MLRQLVVVNEALHQSRGGQGETFRLKDHLIKVKGQQRQHRQADSAAVGGGEGSVLAAREDGSGMTGGPSSQAIPMSVE